jgi:L-iditol 2-dehydrogenase
MKVALLHGLRDLRISEEPAPTPAPGECLVEVKAVTICGSDLHVFAEGNVGGVSWDGPFSPGHEFAGLCYGAANFPDGTPVVADPAISCEKCDMCQRGWQHLCRNLVFAGLPPVQGALRQFIAWPEHLLFPVPEWLDISVAPLIEPLAVAVHALELAPPPPDGKIAILGSGGVGLCILLTARAAGVQHILMTDILPERLALAEKLGAEVTVLADHDNPVTVAKEWTEGLGCDVIYEAAGAPDTPAQALDMVRPKGTVAIAGIPVEDAMTVRASAGRRYEITLAWVRRQNHNYPAAISLVEHHQIDLSPLLTHRFPLEKANDAFELAVKKADNSLRVAIEL